MSALGALPARFRRQRLLIVGCGDVGARVARQLGSGPGAQRIRVLALTSSPERIPALRALGVTPLLGNLDTPATLRRLAGLATRVLHLAPPPGAVGGSGESSDPRTLALVRVLRRGRLPTALVYGSTSGVYGDCGGARINETRATAPSTAKPIPWPKDTIAQVRAIADVLTASPVPLTVGGTSCRHDLLHFGVVTTDEADVQPLRCCDVRQGLWHKNDQTTNE